MMWQPLGSMHMAGPKWARKGSAWKHFFICRVRIYKQKNIGRAPFSNARPRGDAQFRESVQLWHTYTLSVKKKYIVVTNEFFGCTRRIETMYCFCLFVSPSFSGLNPRVLLRFLPPRNGCLCRFRRVIECEVEDTRGKDGILFFLFYFIHFHQCRVCFLLFSSSCRHCFVFLIPLLSWIPFLFSSSLCHDGTYQTVPLRRRIFFFSVPRGTKRSTVARRAQLCSRINAMKKVREVKKK
uniref:Uncharacterized protein TCIL3000_9_480 n=1 Tax=Trypanosoma congolense (strain IL3000) TaxID=1068625 RepID=G0UTE0_TRYCI|nr:unnamed protein product [Trypanosoma congolense IL3000]